MIIVDEAVAAIGGLDLSFGKWDTHVHALADAHALDFSKTLFPGQEYYNQRITDFDGVWNYVENSLGVLEAPRMPWHDVRALE
jgi:phospholipase D1/2